MFKMRFDITKKFKIFGAISIIAVAAGLFALLAAPFGFNLFNFDIDFAGGTTMYYNMGKTVDADIIKGVDEIVKEVTGSKASSIQSAGDGTEIIIKTADIPTEQRELLKEKLTSTYTLADDALLNIENVSPAVGKDMQKSAVEASLIAMALMLIYITIRFDFKSGLSAVVCLMHDVLVMLSVYVIFQLPMNINFIAAALVIFGYSINASIITFDRVRENVKFAGREEFSSVVNRSIWQSMTRTMNTTLTTLVTIVLIFILGVPSLRNFSLPIIIGIVSGAYSSIFIAGPLWAKLKGNKSMTSGTQTPTRAPTKAK